MRKQQMGTRSKFSRIAWSLPAAALGALVSTPLWAQAIGEDALQKMADIMAVKSAMTPAQQKMDSSLVFAVMAARKDPKIAPFLDVVPVLGADAVENSLDTSVAVDIYAEVTPSLLQQITASGGRIETQSAQWGMVHASIPLGSMDGIAANPTVKSIQRWRTLGIAVALTGVLGMGSSSARADEGATAVPHARGEHGRFVDHLSGRIDQALNAANATDQQKAAILPARDRLIAAMTTAKQEARAHKGDVLTLFEGDKLSASQLRKFRSDRKSRFQPVMDASDHFLQVAHDTLRPEQRKPFAESLKQSGFFGGGPHD